MKRNFAAIVSTPLHLGRGWGGGFLMTMGGLHLHAQEFGMEYTTELQTDFRASNFVNLLRLNAGVPLGKSLTIDASTISIAKTRQERLADDLQTFSNIEEDNLPLALSVCGMSWTSVSSPLGESEGTSHTLFVGIRNMNEDYFTSHTTSFFTNSSCGVYPTISANYPIANYPLSSFGLHYRFSTPHLTLQASLYDGCGRKHLTGHGNIFHLSPKNDGIFGLMQMEYTLHGSTYFLGSANYFNNKATGISPWFYTEQRISNSLTLLAGYSHAFTLRADCTDFAGIGLKYVAPCAALGIFTDYARFAESTEWATELTCQLSINDHLTLQPIAHFILTDKVAKGICTLRLIVSY